MKAKNMNSQAGKKEQQAYQDSLKYDGDIKNVIDTAVEEAVDKKIAEIATNAILKGSDDQFIADITGLDLEIIDQIRRSLKN